MSPGAVGLGQQGRGAGPAHERLSVGLNLTARGSVDGWHRRPATVGRRLRVGCSSGGGRECITYDWSRDPSPYEKAWEFQKALVAERRDDPDVADAVILVQHHPVFTLGAGSSLENLNFDPAHPPLPIHRTERGGEVTYHGPGQLVLYPILNLRRHRRDLHWYLRALEDIAIDTLDQVSGLQGGRLEGLTGVWVDGSKVAAIGVRASRWVTYHGLSLNVTNDLLAYSSIVPCGIPDRPVTTVQAILEQEALVEDPLLGPQCFYGGQLLEEYKFGLMDAFLRAFDLQGVPASDTEAKLAGLPLGRL